MTPRWPALLQQHGLDELLPIRDEAHWRADADFVYWRPHANDRVIDADGRVFRALPGSSAPPPLEHGGEVIALAAFSDLVRRHLSAAGQCCVSKIELRDLAEGFALVGQSAD
ncbi:DUF4144 family protein [Derxia lacustris]|uniref:DUF4144 family protein n=1 Tax=Derxia lacustris TaxID=764842 RepID=UPI000A177063|nr:DUF4144 family protein [Derxia lacustris]